MNYTETQVLETRQQMHTSMSYADVLSAIVEGTTKAVCAKGCALLLLTPDRKQFVHRAHYGLSRQYIEKGPLLSAKSLSQALEGKPILALHADRDQNVQYREQAKREGITSILSIPVVYNEEIIGVMRLYTAEARRFDAGEINLLKAIASLGALALQKAEMHEVTQSELLHCNIEVGRLENQRQQLFRFLSMAAHDLKAPLAAVQTYFGVILGGLAGDVSEKQRNILDRCSIRIQELLELISDILDIPKIETGHVLTEIENVSLRPIIDSSVELGQTLCQQKGLEFELDVPKRLPRITASACRLQQVITHLLSNAISYTESGTVKLKVLCGSRFIQFEIWDSGIGIPASELKEIFTDFYRATNNVEANGTGLGLSIAKRIVEAHNGKIWAESPCLETGKGSRFVITIPRSPQSIKGESNRESGH